MKIRAPRLNRLTNARTSARTLQKREDAIWTALLEVLTGFWWNRRHVTGLLEIIVRVPLMECNQGCMLSVRPLCSAEITRAAGIPLREMLWLNLHTSTLHISRRSHRRHKSTDPPAPRESGPLPFTFVSVFSASVCFHVASEKHKHAINRDPNVTSN